jgi:hypothetical protein
MMAGVRSIVPVPIAAEMLTWHGALTPNGFTVNSDFTPDTLDVQLVVSVNSDLSSPAYSSAFVTPTVSLGDGDIESYKTCIFNVTGLTPNTTYYYGFVFSNPGQIGSFIRTVKTAPTAGQAAAFTFVAGSCSYLNNQSKAYDPSFPAIAAENALFLLHMGDVNYPDPHSTTQGHTRDLATRSYRRRAEVDAMHRSTAVDLIWDNHDASFGNDPYLTMPNAETVIQMARRTWRETVPMYPTVQTGLGESNIDHNILTHVFDMGLVRFIVPDIRSQRIRANNTALGQALGGGDYWDQRAWLAGALTQAATDGMRHVFLISTSTWTGAVNNAFGDWFTAERTAICDMIEELDTPVTLLVGDAHESAFDDGTNTGFSTSGFARFPQILASPLAQLSTLTNSGPYSWNGVTVANRFPSKPNLFTKITMSADNRAWTAVCKGTPFTGDVPSTLGTFSSTDVTPAVSFNNAAPSVVHGSPLTVNLDKTWFGACSVHWASSDGQSGDVTFKPNKSRAGFSITFAVAGSPTITLSSPSGCTISGTNPATVTVT